MKFDFTKDEYERIVEELMLKDNELKLDKILEMKIKGYSITKMAMQLNVSEPTISNRIAKLKKLIIKIL